MLVLSIRHKGVKRLYLADDAKGVPPESVQKLRAMLAFIDAMDDEPELLTIPRWKAHQLKGSRKGTWSLTVTGNYRLTFDVDNATQEVSDMDFEDYHGQ
ncbi:MAG: type II toxin-antitoxin system RelE/ParE family toxin [Candidatus Acidiferrales bacterium]